MSVQGVDHIQLPIPPGTAAQARAFYQGLLGLREVRDPGLDRPGTLRFALGRQRLDLSEGRYIGIAPQAHLALQVRSLRSLTRALHAAGLRIDVAPLPSGEERIYVEDPFGNRLELIEPATGADEPTGSHRAADLHFSV
ncbi:MAG TPA: VOC family protein [Burkholderiaceae bacterium]|nr:VOC family protein [Burkholderiaceae bacterium]